MERISQNQTLKVVFAVATYLPYINVTVDRNNTVHYTGLLVDLMNKVADHLNFKYEVVQPVDRSFGVFVNGTWDGLVGMLQRKQVDIAASPLTITYARRSVIDFSNSFGFELIGILIRLPEKTVSTWNILFVFSKEVWLTILASFLCSVIFVRILYYFDFATPDTSLRCNISYCIWLIYGRLINQTCKITVASWSNRIFQLSWRIAAILLISTYAGCLVAALMTEHASLPFTDLKGLAAAVDRNEYKICVANNSAFYSAIMTSVSPEYRILKNWLSNNRDFATSNAECLLKLKNVTNLAFPQEVTYLETLQMQFCADIPMILLEDRFFPGYLAMGFPKNSQLNQQVSQAVSAIVESGMIEKWKSKYSPDPSFCEIPKASSAVVARVNQLILKDFGGPFILFLFGVCVGSTIFVFEKLWKRN